MTQDFCVKITKTVPNRGLPEINFGNYHIAPAFGFCDRSPIATVDGGNHPVRGDVRIRAAHNIHVIFTSTGGSQQRIAAPDRERNHFRATVAEFSGDLLATFEAICAAMNLGNHDNSDPMTDYFDVGHYISISIGAWTKPFKVVA